MLDMYVAQNRELAYRVIEDEAVILTPEDGMLHNLNPVATRIFELANGKRKVKDIVSHILDEFKVDEHTVKKDATNFIEDLAHKKLLVISDKPITHLK